MKKVGKFVGKTDKIQTEIQSEIPDCALIARSSQKYGYQLEHCPLTLNELWVYYATFVDSIQDVI